MLGLLGPAMAPHPAVAQGTTSIQGTTGIEGAIGPTLRQLVPSTAWTGQFVFDAPVAGARPLVLAETEGAAPGSADTPTHQRIAVDVPPGTTRTVRVVLGRDRGERIAAAQAASDAAAAALSDYLASITL